MASLLLQKDFNGNPARKRQVSRPWTHVYPGRRG